MPFQRLHPYPDWAAKKTSLCHTSVCGFLQGLASLLMQQALSYLFLGILVAL